MTSVLVLDCGNALIKAKRTGGQEDEFSHALKALQPADWRELLKHTNDRVPSGYAVVNGAPYAYGTQAERYMPDKSHGARRYEESYYGVFCAIALARLFAKSGNVSLFGSHAPGDVEYRDDLMRAAARTWRVELDDKSLTFEVDYVNTFDEPQGGLMNVILADDGQHYRNSAINGGRALVIDIGGKTTDFLAVNPGGEIDYSLAHSEQIGILDAVRDFTKAFRQNNRTLVKSVDELTADRVREAIATGSYRGAGTTYDCQKEADEAVSALLGNIRTVYHDVAGGPVPWDSIILTGGGSAILESRLRDVLQHNRVLLADEPAKIHFANVRGGMKLWRFYEAEGLVE